MGQITIYFLLTTAQYNLPANLLSSLCYIESRNDINAIHHDDGGADSLGVCQIKLATARGLGFKGTAKDLMNPETNVHYAGAYLAHQIKRYNGSIGRGVIAYNIGSAKHLTITKYQTRVFLEWRKH